MSRHKLVKNLDLDDELDDFDGEEDYDYEGGGDAGEELSEEDQEQMRQGTIRVRQSLPPGIDITDKQIQESLWHYYYDVEKSVSYLASTHTPKAQKASKKATGKKNTGFCTSLPASSCMKHSSYAEFFKDMPWLNVPAHRQTIFIPPLHPRGGLLGGSTDGTPKMSKLQALAAARKKKAQEQKASSSLEVEKPMVNLSLNSGSGGQGKSPVASPLEASPSPNKQRGFPLRKRKDSNPHEKVQKPQAVMQGANIMTDIKFELPPISQAAPSAFASTMFGNPSPCPPRQQPSNYFTLPYIVTETTTSADPFAGPSPDDIVIAAQSKAANKGVKGPPKTNGEKKADQMANSVEAMKLDDTPRSRSKNLDVLAEFGKKKAKNAANFVVIGHVDAGKSTLMGRLLCDLNVIDQRTIDRYRTEATKIGKSSFALAWVLDQGTEERTRGVTIDIAMSKFSTEKTSFTILDAPGHRDFIPNMIAGASQADFAVLVIDASTGSFESGLRGQTKEHALLVRSMGVQRIIIAVNKLDTVSWSQDRFTEITQQISAFLQQAGFQSKNISFIPCSGLLGDNIARKSEDQNAKWYQGPTLVEELDNSEPITRALENPLRLTISDIFRGGVQNPLSISGRIEAGSLQIGDALLAQPSTQKCYIKGLETSEGETVDWAVAGQNVVLHLNDIDPIHLKIGDVLCSPKEGERIRNLREFTAKVLAFEFLMPMAVDVIKGRLQAEGRIEGGLEVLDKGTGVAIGGGTGKKKKPRIVKPGQVARVKVVLEREVPLEKGARIVLRCGGETVAAGLLE